MLIFLLHAEIQFMICLKFEFTVINAISVVHVCIVTYMNDYRW
jgi:hypothetical protein